MKGDRAARPLTHLPSTYTSLCTLSIEWTYGSNRATKSFRRIHINLRESRSLGGHSQFKYCVQFIQIYIIVTYFDFYSIIPDLRSVDSFVLDVFDTGRRTFIKTIYKRDLFWVLSSKEERDHNKENAHAIGSMKSYNLMKKNTS